MMKRFLLILLMLGVVMTPTQSRADNGSGVAVGATIAAMALACGPLAQVCHNSLVGRLLMAFSTRAKIYVNTFMTELGMKYEVKITAAEALNDQRLKAATAQLRANNQIQHGPTGASCAIASVGQDIIMGGRRNTSSVTPTGSTAGADGTAGSAPPSPPVPSSRGADGRRKPVGSDYTTANTAGKPFDTFRAEQVEDLQRTAQLRFDGDLPGSENPLVDAKTQFDEHTTQYSNTEAPIFQNADVSAETILNYDTFPETKNSTGQRTLHDAAIKFCENISTPTILAPNRGKALAENVDRQTYGNERNGWKARLSLVNFICNDAVARRTGKLVDQNSPNDSSGTAANNTTNQAPINDWFTNTVVTYKKLNCVTSTAGATVRAGVATALAGPGGGVASVAVDLTKIKACQDAVDAQLAKGLRVSEYEMLKTVYTRLLFTPQAMQLLGGASQNETLKMMTHLDQLDLALNYRIYEMQQQLAMLKAAQLATMVNEQKGNPDMVSPQ